MADLAALRRHLPAVTRARFERGESYHAALDRYLAGPADSLRVICDLADPYLLPIDGAPHLDGLLQYAALRDGPQPVNAGPWTVPIPVLMPWISPEGLPLYAAGSLLPPAGDPRAEGVDYWHQRQPPWELAKAPNARADCGRYAVRRMPKRHRHVERLEAMVVGDGAEILRLLSAHVPHVGGKASCGYGRCTWRVEPLGWDQADTWAAIQAERPVPIAYYRGEPQEMARVMPSCGWTAPYWYRGWHDACRADYWLA